MLNRRKFLGLGLGAIAVAAIPSSLSAEDFRASKPKLGQLQKLMMQLKKFLEQLLQLKVVLH